MPDFILEYDILETIAKSSKSLGKEAKDYSESLQSKIVRGIDHVTGQSSGYLINASDLVSDKINALKLKSDAFYSFAEQISNLLIVAEQTDQEVADIIAAQREYFLDHHASLRIEDWKAKLLDLLVDVKNSIPLLNLLANILKGLDSILEALADTVKHWYECGGGKYIINVVWSIGEVAFAIAGMVAAVTALATLAVPGAAFFGVCGIIGASIALVNGVTNVFTSCRGADAALDGNPALAVIYGKQDKLSDVLRQKNFGDGSLNTLSNLGAGALDLTETFCDIVGIAEIAGIAKLFQGNGFKQLKNGTLSFSDLKNGAKNGIVDLKNNIKNGYADLKKSSRLDDVGGTVRSDIDLNISKGGKYSAYGEMSEADGIGYRDWNYEKIHEISIHNPNSNSMTLGKYFDGTIKSGSYVARAEATGDTYFSLGTKWDDIEEAYELTDKDMFEMFNESAIDDAVSQGKTIRFSQDPRAYGDCALKNEWEYLKNKYNYKLLKQIGDYWYAK